MTLSELKLIIYICDIRTHVQIIMYVFTKAICIRSYTHYIATYAPKLYACYLKISRYASTL